MKANINVDQKLALKAGKNQHGEIVIDFDPSELTQAQRDTLARCCTDNDGVFDTNYLLNSEAHGYAPAVAEATIETLRLILDAIPIEEKKYIESLKKELTPKLAEWLQRPDGELVYLYGSYCKYREPDDFSRMRRILSEEYGVRIDEKIMRLQNLVERKKEEKREADRKAEEEKDRREAEAERKKEAAAERKGAQLAAWIAANGTENQKARFSEGYLGEREIIEAIECQVFAPLADYDQWGDPDDMVDEDEYEWDWRVKKNLTAEEFDCLSRIRELVPGAVIEPRQYYCTGCPNVTVFAITVYLGELTMDREYRMN